VVIVKGWSSFDSPSDCGIDEARRITQLLVDKLPENIKAEIDEEPRLYPTNRRFVYRFCSGAACRAAERSFNATIRAHGLLINNKRSWASMEQRPEITAANRQIGAMCNALRDWMDLNPELAKHKPAIAPSWGMAGHIRIGRIRVGQLLPCGGWEWLPKNLVAAVSASAEALEMLQMMS
jgi:hypothetical protein